VHHLPRLGQVIEVVVGKRRVREQIEEGHGNDRGADCRVDGAGTQRSSVVAGHRWTRRPRMK